MPALVHETLASANLLDAEHPPFADALAYAFHKCPGFNFLPSVYDGLSDGALPANGSFASAHFSCDAFRMYEFKVRRCMRGRSHDWTECPFAHPGEKARRRDPRRIHYSGSPCPDFRKGSCRRGEACEFAHGVFECWLHPARYRTQECKDGQNCKRRVCFFAHSPEQLRVLPGSPEQRTTRAERAFDRAAGSCVEESNNGFSENAPFPNFTGIMKAHQFSPSLAASQTQTFPPPVQASLLAMHQDLTSVSGLRRPAAQNVLSYKGHGINLDAAEYIPVVDVNDEGLPKPHVACTPYLSTMQHVHLRNCRDENLFAKFSLPAEMSSYDFSNHSHGFNSPTSILTGHIFSPPPLSPPLSPSNSPNSNDIKQFFTDSANDCHNSFVEILHKNICDQIVARDNPRDMEDLGLRLQNLHVAFLNGAGYAEPNPGMGTEAELSTNLVQQPRISPFKNPALNFTHTSKQVEGGYASEFACSDCSIFDIWRLGEATAQNLSISNLREDRPSADKFEPDVSWVNELVK